MDLKNPIEYIYKLWTEEVGLPIFNILWDLGSKTLNWYLETTSKEFRLITLEIIVKCFIFKKKKKKRDNSEVLEEF